MALLLILAYASDGASIRGSVIDPSGWRFQGADVTLFSPPKSGPLKTVTDVSGEFIFEGIPPGTYEVRVQARGFSDKRQTGIQVTDGADIQLPQ